MLVLHARLEKLNHGGENNLIVPMYNGELVGCHRVHVGMVFSNTQHLNDFPDICILLQMDKKGAV